MVNYVYMKSMLKGNLHYWRAYGTPLTFSQGLVGKPKKIIIRKKKKTLVAHSLIPHTKGKRDVWEL
jgi:hypothetical protein